MSLPLLPFSWWLSGTNENSVPSNDNALRSMIFGGSAISDSVSVQPSFTTPADDGKWYVLPPGATGSQWSGFGADSVAIFYGGNWYEFTPVDGAIIGIDGALYAYDGSSGWTALAGGGGETETITTYTSSQVGVIGDEVVRMNSSSALMYTVPTNASVPHPIGKVIELWQAGTGVMEIAAAGGVTVNVRAGLGYAAVGQYSGASLRKVGTNEWYLVGDLEPAS